MRDCVGFLQIRSQICSCLSMLSHSMSSDRRDAGLSLCGMSVLVSVVAISRVVALTGQADVAVIAVDSGAAALVKLTANWWRDFPYSGGAEVDLPSRKGE